MQLVDEPGPSVVRGPSVGVGLPDENETAGCCWIVVGGWEGRDEEHGGKIGERGGGRKRIGFVDEGERKVVDDGDQIGFVARAEVEGVRERRPKRRCAATWTSFP